MAKIYYSIDTTTIGYPVHWLDASGNEHVDVVESHGHAFPGPADIDQEFQHQHPGAVYLAWDKFCVRMALIAHEKEKLALWNQGEAKKTNTWGTSWE